MCIVMTRLHFLSVLKTIGWEVRHIVVDEAQNFRNEEGNPDWFQSLFKILKWGMYSEQSNDEDSSLYIFIDDLQKIRDDDCGLSFDNKILPRVCELNCVIRNSTKIYEKWQTIARERSNFRQDLLEIRRKKEPIIGHDYEGRDVVFVTLTSRVEERVFVEVEETINKVLSGAYEASDVAVLFNTLEISKRFESHISSRQRCVTNAETFPRQGLVVDSFRRFSGLEAPVVIAVDPKPTLYENTDEAKIMLYSRAMVELYIMT